jgi:hypothetical protein
MTTTALLNLKTASRRSSSRRITLEKTTSLYTSCSRQLSDITLLRHRMIKEQCSPLREVMRLPLTTFRQGIITIMAAVAEVQIETVFFTTAVLLQIPLLLLLILQAVTVFLTTAVPYCLHVLLITPRLLLLLLLILPKIRLITW